MEPIASHPASLVEPDILAHLRDELGGAGLRRIRDDKTSLGINTNGRFHFDRQIIVEATSSGETTLTRVPDSGSER
jgi:hypothetical protein